MLLVWVALQGRAQCQSWDFGHSGLGCDANKYLLEKGFGVEGVGVENGGWGLERMRWFGWVAVVNGVCGLDLGTMLTLGIFLDERMLISLGNSVKVFGLQLWER